MDLSAVELDKNLVKDYCFNKHWQELTKYLREKFSMTINDVTGQPNPILITQSTIDTLGYILKELIGDNFQNIMPNQLTMTTEVFRALRNSVAFNLDVQTVIAKDVYIFSNTLDICQDLLRLKVDSDNKCVKMIIQFLTNAVTKNADNAVIVWKIFGNIITELFVEPECSYLASALLYNIVYLNRYLIKDCNQLYSYVLEAVTAGAPNEYYTFLLEIFVQDVNFMNTYETYEITHRVMILTVLTDLLSNKNYDYKLNCDTVQHMAVLFKSKSDCILKTETSYVDNIEPQEVVMLLEILASLSSREGYCEKLQDDKGLIINCAFLLKSIDALGTQSQNNFTPIQKLSEVASSNSAVRENPVFGFKADLIRLLGNVCWKNKENQDKLRELDCIPLLLNCCNIDARNPFIIQWTILAIRNVCHDNPANQAVIAGMTKQGVVNSATLQEMGMTLHDDGTSKIVIGPLPDNH